MIKITVLGDMMCEPLLLKASKRDNGYDFSGVFANVKGLLQEADFVIGNLETPMAGAEAGYTSNLFSFNAPDEFALAVKNAGISLVTTANNHCVDRGFQGLLRTLEALDRIGLAHIGTWRDKADRKEAFYYEKDGQRIAIVTSCYGTNHKINHCSLSPEEESHINLLHAHTEPVYEQKPPKRSFANKIINYPFRFLSAEKSAQIKKKLHMTYNTPREDSFLNEETAKPYVDRMCSDIRSAKKNADLVIFYPHIGGQFNHDPGRFTKYIFDKAIEAGGDIIIASHPHIVQKAEMRNEVPCFYSIGNFSMSPNSYYLLHENLPEYGLAVHLYIEQNIITDITFSVLKMIEPKGKLLTVYPVDVLADKMENEAERSRLRRDVAQIYSTVTGKTPGKEFSIREEYTALR